MSERAAVFIDGGYLGKICPHKIDFSKLVEKILGEKILYRAYYYNCLPYTPQKPSIEDDKRLSKALKFYHSLKSIPRFCVRLGKLRLSGYDKDTGSPLFQQKRVDLMLGLDISSIIQTQPRVVDVVVLLTGDGDMLPAVEAARNANHIVVLAHGNKNTYDQELWNNADERIYIDSAFFNDVAMHRP